MTYIKCKKSGVKYNFPAPDDPGWNIEVSKLMPYLFGAGIDVGGGTRTPKKDQTRLDIDPKMCPDIAASADETPCKDNEYDYLTAIHVLEHFEYPGKAIREWLRIIKPGGTVCLIVPDREFTGTSDKRRHPKKGTEPMWHYTEWTLQEFKIWLKKMNNFEAKIIDIDEALVGWSFYVIIQKI